MRFMMLVKATKDFEAGVLPDEKMLSEMAKYTEELVKAGALLAGERLQPSSKGARVRYANGKFTVIDGPFAETKELIAGFCLIEAKSREEAIEWAKRIPFQEGEVEVRPLFELTDFPVDPAEKPDGWREKEEQFRAAPPARKPGTIRYMGILKADKDTEAGVLPDEKFLSAMGAFMEEGVKAGVFLSGEGLQPSSKGARVRYSGSKRMVTDGPFAETKELIAGYAILQFTSKAEAIEWTKRFVQVDAPGRLGAESECEIRPFFEDFLGQPCREARRRRTIGDTKMRFMILMKATKDSEAGVMPSEQLLTEMGKFNEELVKAGVMLAGEGLHPTSKGARVRFSGGKRTVIDGPFAETKELIAGFWIWQCKSKEEAIEWVKRCPNPHNEETEVEIRQVFEAEDFGAEFTPELKEQEERIRAQIATKQK